MEAKKREAIYFQDSKGREPAKDWLGKLKDKIGQARIFARIARAQTGNFGDDKSVGEGVQEMRIEIGPNLSLLRA